MVKTDKSDVDCVKLCTTFTQKIDGYNLSSVFRQQAFSIQLHIEINYSLHKHTLKFNYERSTSAII
jgi:hypothetical protein